MIKALFIFLSFFSFSLWAQYKSSDDCVTLEMTPPNLRQALAIWHDKLPDLMEHLGWDQNRPHWYRVIDEYLDPFMRSKSHHVVISIVGPANSGKSTLFNNIANEGQVGIEFSSVDYSAGQTARPMILLSKEVDSEVVESRFGTTDAWKQKSQSANSGPPILLRLDGFFDNLAIIDTPSIDVYYHRESAKRVFTWSDVVFYVFSGSNYKNDFNLSAMKEKFRDTGGKHIVLFYRVHEGIPENTAYEHFAEIVSSLAPEMKRNTSEGFPSFVIGAYIMRESDAVAWGKEPPSFVPFGGSLPLAELLKFLNANSDDVRKRSLDKAFRFALTRTAAGLHELHRRQDERRVAQELMYVIIDNSVREMIGAFPYRELGLTIPDVTTSLASWPRQTARLIGDPLRSFKKRLPPRLLSDQGGGDVEPFVNAVVENAFNQMLLWMKRGYFSIPSQSKEHRKLKDSFDAYRDKYGVPAGEMPFLILPGKESVIRFSPGLFSDVSKIIEYQQGELAAKIKGDSIENLRAISARLRDDFSQVTKTQHISGKALRSTYVALSLIPMAAALGYFFYAGDLVDVKPWGALVAAHLTARFFVHLDDRSLKREWDAVIQRLFREQQAPRVKDIFNQALKTYWEKGLAPKEMKSLEEAVNVLLEHANVNFPQVTGPQ